MKFLPSMVFDLFCVSDLGLRNRFSWIIKVGVICLVLINLSGLFIRVNAGLTLNADRQIIEGSGLLPSESSHAPHIPVASTFTVRGTIFDVTTRQPMPGVNVIIKGTARGTSSDDKGGYSLDVEGNETLIFTFIGYKSMIIDVENRSAIDVMLEQDMSILKEVTINGGYYETTDRLKTGSIVKVVAKDIEKQPVTSPLMALQGRVPGLEITPSSGAPGVAPKIRIRGTNSLRQNRGGVAYSTASQEDDGNYPLYVIDGVPVNSVPFSTHDRSSFSPAGYDPLSTINPTNIESIEVLKDGDATAIYGSRGANGVILIKTKRNSKPSEHTNIETSIYSGFGQVSKQMHVLNLGEYLTMRREALSNGGLTFQQGRAIDLYLWDTTRYTNWQKVLLGGNAHINDLQSGISSSTKNTSFRFNGGYHRETLLFPGDFGYYRLSGQLSVSHISMNQKFKVSLSNTYGLDRSHFFSGSVMSAALMLSPNAPKLYNNDGSLNWEIRDVPEEGRINTWTNPLSYMKITQDADTRNNISNASLGYEIFQGILLSANLGYTDISSKERKETPQSSQSPVTAIGNVRSALFTESRRNSWVIEPKVSYSRQIRQNRIEVIAGGTWQRNTYAVRRISGEQYVSDALLGSLQGAGRALISLDDFTEYRYNSIYARLGYNSHGKYILNITGRRDGSSRFGPGNRFGNFGSIGAAWIFSGEKFIQQAFSFMNFGKVRVSYGVTGTDNIGDYNYYNLYNTASGKYGVSTGLVPYALYNPNYAWEVTDKLESALELAFAQNRVGLEINWYRNRSSNQLINYPLSDVTGFQSVQSNFAATVQNSGWEAVVRGDLLNSNSWQWNASLNVSLPRNRLIKFDDIEYSPYATIYKVGQPLSVLWYYTSTGVNRETGLHEFVDQNGDGILNDLDRTLQNLAGHVYYGGITNTISHKNFEISFLFQFSHTRSTLYLPALPGDGAVNQPVEVLSRWRHSGDETNVQKFVNHLQPGPTGNDAYRRYNFLQLSNYNSVDASFVRLKTLSVGYRLQGQGMEKIRMQETRVFLQGQNLLTVTRYQGLDPETGAGLPPLRMITVGLQLRI